MKRYSHWTGIILITVLAALVYLPLIRSFGYYNDDWYLMYSAGAHGPAVFQDIFSVDRPGRALVMIPAYTLFGDNPLYYNLSAFVFRVVSALALFWALNLLWPRRPIPTTAMSLFFLLYPGFLSQPNAIDYQSHIVGLAAAVGSIALTLKAVSVESRIHAALWHILSVLLGWLYLSQMEWYISFEFFRWACVFLLASRMGGTVLQKGIRAIKWAYPSLAVPLFFLIWRLFFFVSERGATDVDMQFERLRLYPLQTLFHWAVQVLQDLFDVLLGAWVLPLSQLMAYIQTWSGLLGIVMAGSIFFLLFRYETGIAHETAEQPGMKQEALLLGLFTAIAGLIPIAMVNREVAFPSFSRYSLISSVGVAIVVVALLGSVRGRIRRNSLFAGLLLIAILTHHANSVKFARDTTVAQNFWWQVSWRVPQFEPRTTLIGNYPAGAIEEDYFIWGPANLIYYPEPQLEGIQPAIYASILNKGTVTKVLARERQEFDNRKNIITYKNYRNILILSQPTLDSCVHVINGAQPEFSQSEWDSIRAIGSYSEMEHILMDEAPHTPPAVAFGPEPTHGWCYYYQKADLARQRGDWDEVLILGNEAFEKGLSPKDEIEWMPFLQAYAHTGDTDRLAELAPIITSSPYIAQQACRVIGSLPGLSAAVADTVDSLYCPE